MENYFITDEKGEGIYGWCWEDDKKSIGSKKEIVLTGSIFEVSSVRHLIINRIMKFETIYIPDAVIEKKSIMYQYENKIKVKFKLKSLDGVRFLKERYIWRKVN